MANKAKERIKIDRNKCIGCLMCVTACKIAHEASDAKNRVVIDSKNKNAPIFCRQCDQPECVYACMTGAMHRDPDNGYIVYDKDRCVSCYMCVMSCPYGVLKADSIHGTEIEKCNMCVHRSEDGMTANPMCVEKCPMGAITLEEVER